MNAAPVPEITTSVRQFTNTNLQRLTQLQTALQNAKVFDSEAIFFAKHYIDSAIGASDISPFNRLAEQYTRMLWEAVEWKTVDWTTVKECTKSINDQLEKLIVKSLPIDEGFEQFFTPMLTQIRFILKQSIRFCCMHSLLSREQVALLHEFYGDFPPLSAKEFMPDQRLDEKNPVEVLQILKEDVKESKFFNPLDGVLASTLKAFRTNTKADARDLTGLWHLAQSKPSTRDRLTVEEILRKQFNKQQQQQQQHSVAVLSIIAAALMMQQSNFSFQP